MSKAGLWNGAEPWNCTWGTGIRFREITEFFGFRSISFHENHENLHDSHWKFYEFPCVKLLGFYLLPGGAAFPWIFTFWALKKPGKGKSQLGSSLTSSGNNSQAVLLDSHPRKKKKSVFSFFQPQLCLVLFPFSPAATPPELGGAVKSTDPPALQEDAVPSDIGCIHNS